MRPSQPFFRKLTRLALTTKQAAKGGGYYKGTGTGPLGVHTKHGGYRILWRLVRTYVVPSELKDCKVCSGSTRCAIAGSVGKDQSKRLIRDGISLVEPFRHQSRHEAGCQSFESRLTIWTDGRGKLSWPVEGEERNRLGPIVFEVGGLLPPGSHKLEDLISPDFGEEVQNRSI